jgi:hypothetical protein
MCNLHRGNTEPHCAMTMATSKFYVPVVMRHSSPAFRYMSCPRRMLYKGWRHRSHCDSSANRIHRPARRERGIDLRGQHACEGLLRGGRQGRAAVTSPATYLVGSREYSTRNDSRLQYGVRSITLEATDRELDSINVIMIFWLARWSWDRSCCDMSWHACGDLHVSFRLV